MTTKNESMRDGASVAGSSGVATAPANEKASAHTPGPWDVASTRGGKLTVYAVGRGDDWSKWWIARPLSARPKERDANARLIAAAPDLLRALVVLLNTSECPCIAGACDENCTHEIARRAIAKAAGQ